MLIKLRNLVWILKLYSYDPYENYRWGKMKRDNYVRIKQSKRSLIYKIHNFPLHIQKIDNKKFNCHKINRLINKNIKKWSKHKEEIELSALLNIYAKSKNGLEKFFQKYVSLKDFRKK